LEVWVRSNPSFVGGKLLPDSWGRKGGPMGRGYEILLPNLFFALKIVAHTLTKKDDLPQ